MTTQQELVHLLEQVSQLAGQLPDMPNNGQQTDRLLLFTEKETSRMPKDFRKTFRANGRIGRIRKRNDGSHGYGYEIRYRRDGYNISVSATTLEKAKEKFIKATLTATKAASVTNDAQSAVPTDFNGFAQYYFDNFRVRTVTAKTMTNDLSRYNKHILPVLGSLPLNAISPQTCQSLIDSLSNSQKTAHEVFSLINGIFKMAIKHNLIVHNPCDIVYLGSYEKKHGTALTRDEEELLLSATAGTPYQLMFAVALYTGMRPNEYSTARIDGAFIIARNSKQKDGKAHYKRIPVSPKLAPYITADTVLHFASTTTLTRHFKDIMPKHKLYDLRTTFYTRCIECGVSDIARKLFVGHSLGGLATAYTDVSDEYLMAEAAKLIY